MENDFGTPFYETVRINDEFKNIIKSGNYEELILKLMNKSTKLFPNNYERVISQSHGECDFIDLKTFEKYDAKLLLNKKQGNWLGSKNSNFEKWIQSMIDEIADYSEIIKDRKWDEEIEKLSLYQIMENTIKKEPEDENIIFFIPFTIVPDSSGMIFNQFVSDILTFIYDSLEKNNVIGKRKIYVLYVGIAKELIIRYMNKRGVREYFSNEELAEYIDYTVSLHKIEIEDKS